MEDKKSGDFYCFSPDGLYPTQEEKSVNVYSEVVERKKRHIRLTFGRSNFRALIVPFISSDNFVLAMHMLPDVVSALAGCNLDDIQHAIGKMIKLSGSSCYAYWKNDYLIFKAEHWVSYGEDMRNDGATLNFSKDSTDAHELVFVGDDEAQECELTIQGVVDDLNATEKERLADVLSRTSMQASIVSFLNGSGTYAEFRLANRVLDAIGPFSAMHMKRAIDCNECLVEIDDCVVRLVKPDVCDPGASYMVLAPFPKTALVISWAFVFLAVLWAILGGAVYIVLNLSDMMLYALPIVALAVCSFIFWAMSFRFWKCVKSKRAIAALPAIDFLL